MSSSSPFYDSPESADASQNMPFRPRNSELQEVGLLWNGAREI